MTLFYRLEDLVDRKLVEWMLSATPDELAPQLGRIVRELLYNETEHLRNFGVPFVGTTVLTDNFKKLLSNIFEALRRNSIFAKWLNLDMGSGKTHLLALITYVFYAYDILEASGILNEYQKLGLTNDAAQRTALLVIDLRTPSEFFQTYLQFFARTLRKIGEIDAATYIEQCAKLGKVPDAQELVSKLRFARFVILIDELHHAILTYRTVEKERRMIENILTFIIQLINYLRFNKYGFVLLVASARRDYERLQQIPQIENDSLIIQTENLLSQIGRLEQTVETRWLSVAEAKQIILRKLNAKKDDVIHPLFDKFIERIVKAESDIPQAQHLRSLIKAFAVYTSNAISLGHKVITPAAFSEAVIDALFPEGGGIADRYRSIYNSVIHEIDRIESASYDTKYIARLIINTIFTMSISGRTEQLIESIKAHKLGRYTVELLPAVSEKEIENLLNDLAIKDSTLIAKAFEIISGIPYIHSVKLGHTYIYFVVPVESVVALFNRYIDERYRHYIANRDIVLGKFIQWLYIISGEIDNSSIKVVGSFNELEAITKGLDPNKMYIIVYAEPEFIKYIGEALKRDASIDKNKVVKEWFKQQGIKDLATWIAEHRRYNIAIVIPIPVDDVLRDMAIYSAIEDSIAKIVSEYLEVYRRESSKLPEEIRKLIDIELDDIHRALNDRFIEAIRNVNDAYSKALSYVYIYECSVTEHGYTCSVQPIDLSKAEVSKPSHSHISISRWIYAELVDQLNKYRDAELRNVASYVVGRIKRLANFVDDVQEAYRIISKHVEDMLGKSNVVEIVRDMNTFVFNNRIFYIPSSTLIKATESINENDLGKRLGVEIRKVVSRDGVRFEVVGRQQIVTLPKEEQQKAAIQEIPQDVTEILSKYEQGVLEISIEFNRDTKALIRSYLSPLKRFIKRIRVIPS